MATKRKSKQSVARRQAARRTQQQIAALQKLGLIKPKVKKPRGKKPGGSVYRALKKFADVLEGKAAVLKAPPKTRKKYKGTLRQAHGKIVVPKTATTKRVTISKKTGEVRLHQDIAGRKTSDVILPKNAPASEIPKGKNITYAIQLKNHRSKARFVSREDLLEFLLRYDLRNHMDSIEIVYNKAA